MSADEAHKPHESELQEWLQGLRYDAAFTLGFIPRRIHKLLHDMRLVNEDHTLSSEGLVFLGETNGTY